MDEELRQVLAYYRDIGIDVVYQLGTPAHKAQIAQTVAEDAVPTPVQPPPAQQSTRIPPPATAQQSTRIPTPTQQFSETAPAPQATRIPPPPEAQQPTRIPPPAPQYSESAPAMQPTRIPPPAAAQQSTRIPPPTQPLSESAPAQQPTRIPPPPAAAQEPTRIPPPTRSTLTPPPANLLDMVLPSLDPPDDTLEKISADIGDCRRCRLHSGRHNIVFGVGDPAAKLVFVGEGPGEDEDLQGIPFVGRAGQLLTAMIENTASKEGIPLKRADVYICNVVKCRPPQNRTPEPDEMEMCGQFLSRQLAVMKPKAICALGGTATRALLGRKEGVTKMRGNWYKWRDIPVMVTYHPSYLLRAYNQTAKREAWEDLKKLFHFVYD